ncbi:hypothetical protein [uncultured Aquimarina sp.]|uniref:hypothetical protein n=1 Tax=uncultured Aquimarina sp. TaxID=575652 RepID=UPI0026380EBD|nr:hypothetical protein [uncultured Aquimarina sp.]
MKNLKSLKESLSSKKQGSRELTAEERKAINGGQFDTLEECYENCGGTDGGWGYYSGSGKCEPTGQGDWDCYES